MASPATQPAPPPGKPVARDGVDHQAIAYDEFIDTRIRKTRAAVKTADLATAAVALLAWALAVLLIGAVADHWLVAGGFDRWGRFAMFVVGLLGAGLYVATRLGPTLFRRVNPLYAAREIERESPELKNSLLNLLQLRGTPGAGAAAVQQTLERQAAEGLAATGDAPIDQTPVVRAAQVLLALVAAIGIYVVASPKDFFASAGRVLAPWANIAAPSRVQITELKPGGLEVAQGSQLEITASVAGLADDEFAEVVYSTADGRVVEGRLPMRSASGGLRHRVSLPAGGGAAAALGLQGDLTYRLEAGDARTPNYRVAVRTAPTIAPIRVRYQYPAYTGFASREVEGVGDLRALDGTRVTLTARANLPIAAAQIDLGADGRPDVAMRADGDQATGGLTLRRDAADATQTTTNYVLRFTSTDDQANHDPPRYRVEVLADLPPETEILSPAEETLDVAVNQSVRIEAEARDPDFALGGLRLVGEAGGRRVLNRDLPIGAGQGLVKRAASLTPSDLGLRPGDTLTYWIEAIDNRTPKANTGRSESQRLRVTGPSENAQREEPPRDGQPGEAGGEAGGEGKPQPGENGDARPGEPSRDEGQSSGQNTGQNPSQQDPPGDESPAPDQANEKPEQGSETNPNERPEAEPGEDNGGDKGESPEGGLQGPGQQGNEQSDNADQPPEGGSEGDANGEQDAPPQAGGGTGSETNNSRPGAGDDAPNSGGQSGGDSRPGGDPGAEGGPSEDEQPVPSNGEDDGSAFERIRKFLQDQQPGDQPNQQPPRDGGQQPQDGRDQPDAQQSNDRDGNADPSNKRGEPTPDEPGQPGESSPGSDEGQSKPRDGGRGEQPERPEDGPGPGERDRSGQSSDSSSSESGGETPPGESTDPNAGPREGTGSAGQNQAADQGAGQADDRGAGDTAGQAGGEQQAEGETGESGNEPGDGSQRPTDGGQQPGGEGQPGETGDGTASESGDPSPSPEGAPRDSGGEPGSDDPGASNDQPLQDQRGEGPGDQPTDPNGKPTGIADRGDNAGLGGDGSEVGGDEANLDYAREQTDLVLERLEEQLAEREVDRKLLDKLGWSEQELRRFVERWQTRKQQAARRGPEGEAQLDRALRSLGLRPEGPSAVRAIEDDQLRDLRQGVRTKVPARWREAVERYNRSLNAAPRGER